VTDDITLRRIAERYADEPEFKHEMDLAMGVRHVPLHPEGECVLCDAHRARVDEPPTEQIPGAGQDGC
jgi:hypothetical protein